MLESNEMLTLRAMAWERAKGELRAYLETFWPKYAPSGQEIDNGFESANARIEAFIRDFEDNCR
jgi:hypothetical protein